MKPVARIMAATPKAIAVSAARPLPREQRPALALADTRHDPGYLRSLLGDARAQIRHALAAIDFLGLALLVLSRRAAPAQPFDLAAERRLLGGLLHHRDEVSDATAAEVEGGIEVVFGSPLATFRYVARLVDGGWLLVRLPTGR